MIFVVKTSEHPSPPSVCSLSSVAKTIRRGGEKERDEGRREEKSKAEGEGIVWGSRGSLLEEGFAAPLLLA